VNGRGMETTLDIAFEMVQELVRTFEANKHAYLEPDYLEAQARKDFIDKFFIALGWDVNHDIQKNPYEQEVKVEPPVSVGATQRHADYAFRLAPDFYNVRFFVEAKKPLATIATKENYFQVIHYGWNSQTPLAVLSDFQHFYVLDCRYKPDPDTALHRAVAAYYYTDYADREKFARIYWLFSREAVAADSLEKRAAELPKPRGKAVQRGLFPGAYKPVDESFLEELDEFRIELARAFKTVDPDLDSETLTELAQRTLDRLVFLRFLEDKGIEIQRFVDKFGDKGTVWEDFIASSRRFDDIYNGIVFKRHSILDASSFRVDDAVFGEICERLASVNTPYDFNSIPIHILGSIYERFLGKVIVATAKRVRVEEKPGVRKAGGVYYTPEYISRYIVENTVGKLIANRTPDEIATMRFADIACGSGSFLLCIYDLLLQYHGSYYNDLPESKKARAVKRGDCIERDGKLYVSLHKKREILLNNIFGVDIDAQAVEVTQFSLFLRLLQDETTVSAHQYLLDFQHIAEMKKLLPDLSKNIVCGNSLIGTDILEGELFVRDEERKLNPMNFADAFPEVMKRGGFDAMVGNPPYIFTRETIAVRERGYYSEKYLLSWEKQNTYMLFMERLLQLIGPAGVGSYIVPNSWLTIESAKLLRERYLLHLLRVVDLNYPAFQGVSMEPSIFIVGRTETDAPIELARIKSAEQLATTNYVLANRPRLQKHNRIVFHESDSVSKLIELILATTKPLGELFDVRTGLQAYEKGKGNPAQTAEDVRNHIFDRKHRENKNSIPYLEGKDVERYGFHWSGLWMQYGPWLSQPREIGIFTRPRILLREITGHPRYCLHHVYVEKQFLNNKSILNVLDRDDNRERLKALVGVLNSRLLSFFYKRQAVKSGRNIFPKVVVKDLGRFPVPEALVTESVSKLAQKVDAMLEAKKQLVTARADKDKTYYENKCASLDRQIDLIVYDLYGLTEDEIKLVEDAEDHA
jgi:adenine-specific DNA-methyltransferase